MGSTEPRRPRVLHGLSIVVDDSHGQFSLIHAASRWETFSHRIPYS
jgi:hypothetical protein